MPNDEVAIIAERCLLNSRSSNTPVPAYFSRPLLADPTGAVVVYHSSAGWTPAVKEIGRRVATYGYLCLVPNLHDIDAPGEQAEIAAQRSKDAGGVSDDHVLATFGACLDYFQTITAWNGMVGTLGYCAGGRQSFLTACKFPTDAAVVCYGGNIVPTGSPSPERLQRQPVPPIEFAEHISCKVLGLFGEEDGNPSPDHVAQISQILTRLNKPHEFTVYEGTGHAFFDVTRDEYRPQSVNDGWSRVRSLFESTLTD